MAQIDHYPHDHGVIAPSTKWETITPNDSTDLAVLPQAVSVGSTAGVVACVDEDGNESDFYFQAGEMKPIRPVRIKSTNTTATPVIIHK
ncbi:MAG: hypothetical protein GVY18_07645 [Bacteroidetes bacterium]|jgi:hypothetical protein|nr:hypothetical protein [Bacteroidota bacterium]